MKVLLKEWVKNAFPKFSKKLIPRSHNCHLKNLTWLSYYISYLATYLNHNWYVSLISATLWTTEIVDECSKQILRKSQRFWKLVPVSLTRLQVFCKIIFCNALSCIQTLVTYYCFAKELLSLCKTTYSVVCAFQYLLLPEV